MPSEEVYSVVDWAVNFENCRTREVKTMTWVSLPVTLSPDCVGFLMARPNGLRNYGLYVWLVQIAANMPKRGVLEDARGPLTAKRIAMMIRATEAEVQEGLTVLSDPEIGLLSRHCTTLHDVAQIPCMSVLSVLSVPEGTKNEQTPAPQPGFKYPPGHVDQEFTAFWNAYPANRQRARTTVRKFWIDNDLTRHAPKIMAALAKDKASGEWTKDGGKFVGNLAEWLDRDWDAPINGTPDKPADPHADARAEAARWFLGLAPDHQDEFCAPATPTMCRSLAKSGTFPLDMVEKYRKAVSA